MKCTNFINPLVFVAVAAVVVIIIGGCTALSPNKRQTQTSNKEQTGGQQIQYTCSMHPEVVQDEPGDCPKCGMKLEKKH